jgi:hypothetical protein
MSGLKIDPWGENKRCQNDTLKTGEEPTVIVSVGDVLTLESANETMARAQQKQIALQVAGPLVMEGEHTLLFADTNLGKSIFATQIALAAASGRDCLPELENETEPHKVLYVDFELGPQQFGRRYAKIDGKTLIEPFSFPENFIRAEIDPAKLPPGDLGGLILAAIRQRVQEGGFQSVVVDNITWLSDDTEKGDAAGVLMKAFHCLVRELSISILTLAHTPKVPSYTPITINYLAGSKKLANFADAVFAIGRDWRNPDTHAYMKQLKVRAAGALEYGTDNVIVMERAKPENFLGFEFRHFASEDDIIRQESDRERDERQSNDRAKILSLKKQNPNASLRELGEMAGTSHMKVKRTLDSCNA